MASICKGANPMGKLINIKDLMSAKYPEQKWMTDRLIPANAITILSGEPGSFKTYLLLDIALAAVNDTPLFGQFETSATGVLMIDEENGERLLQQRLGQLGATNEELPIYFYSLQDFILTEEKVRDAIKDCKSHDINLVMVDSLVRVHNSDENRSGDMAAVFKQLRRFTSNGITVLVTHHNRKPGKDGGNARHDMRGSSDILASVDSHLSLKRDMDDLILSQLKQRYANELNPIKLHIAYEDDISFSFEYIGGLPFKQSRAKLAEEAILTLLEQNGEMLTYQIAIALEADDLKVNEKKQKDILDKLVADSKINRVNGKGNEKFYSLRKEESAEPEQQDILNP